MLASGIFIAVDGERKGPYPVEQIRQFIEDGLLKGEEEAWHEGLDEWVPLNQLEIIQTPDIFIAVDGERKGPYPVEQIRQFIEDGLLKGEEEAWHEGLDEWVSLSRIEGVTPLGIAKLSQPEAAPATSGPPVPAATSGPPAPPPPPGKMATPELPKENHPKQRSRRLFNSPFFKFIFGLRSQPYVSAHSPPDAHGRWLESVKLGGPQCWVACFDYDIRDAITRIKHIISIAVSGYWTYGLLMTEEHIRNSQGEIETITRASHWSNWVLLCIVLLIVISYLLKSEVVVSALKVIVAVQVYSISKYFLDVLPSVAIAIVAVIVVHRYFNKTYNQFIFGVGGTALDSSYE